MVIALGFILPGVSGGVLAAIMGIYERLVRFMANIRSRFTQDFPFFIPVGIGGVLGLVLLSRPLEWALSNWQVPVLWFFAGAIIGTLPSLWRESTQHSQRDPVDWAWLIGTAILGGALFYVLPMATGSVPANFAGFLLAGGLIALGVLVPGLSPSNLLLILGLFTPMLQGFSDRNVLGVFLPIAVGAIVVMLSLAKIMERLLDSAHSRVYHFIIGLVISSTILIVIPTHSEESISYAGASTAQLAAAGGLAVVGLALGLWMSHLEGKYKVVSDEIDEVESGATPGSR
jgi:putative membrane protein